MSRRFFLHWLPLLLWMGVIFGASTKIGSSEHTSRFVRPFLIWLDPGISEEAIGRVHTAVRKTAHFVEYAILGILIWRVVASHPSHNSSSSARVFAVALLLAALYASTDEAHQIFVPGREASVRDVCLDTAGAACGLAAILCARRARKLVS